MLGLKLNHVSKRGHRTTTTVVCIKLRRMAGKKSTLNKRGHMWQNNKLQFQSIIDLSCCFMTQWLDIKPGTLTLINTMSRRFTPGGRGFCDISVQRPPKPCSVATPQLNHMTACQEYIVKCASGLRMRHDDVMKWKKKCSAVLALCEGNSTVTGEFPSQRPVTRSVDIFSDLHLDKWLSKQSRPWWFETSSRTLWRHCYGFDVTWGRITRETTKHPSLVPHH